MRIKEAYLKRGSSGRSLKEVKAVVLHWVANDMSSAMANRNYWENVLANGIGTHEIVDLDGSVLMTLPPNTMGYQVGAPSYTSEALRRLSSYPNNCVYGIEATHLDMTGKMSPETYNSLVERTAYNCERFGLTANDVWTHHEIVGRYKDCHRWFTRNPNEWKKFKSKVAAILDGSSPEKATEAVQLFEGGTYEVQKGDTLYEIAEKSGTTVKKLKQLNKDVDAKNLKVGSTIRVAETETHKITKGDTFYAIAKTQGMTVNELQALNPSVNPRSLRVGEKINLSKKKAPKKDVKNPWADGLLQRGEYGEPVKALQRKLNKAGYHVGQVDGSFGSKTEGGVIRLQKAYNLRLQNGIFGDNTAEALRKSLKPKHVAPTGTIRLGDRGNNVRQLQDALNAVYFKVGQEDGIFGEQTLDGLKRFQSVYTPQDVDGIYGSRTRAQLVRKLKTQ